MLQVNWCTFCVLLFLTTTESRTENRDGISGALSDDTNAFHDTADTDDSNMQIVLPDTTDQDDWETTRYQILSSVMERLSTVRSVEDLLKLGLMGSNRKPLTAQGLAAFYDSKADKLMINGNGEVAVAAECVPREMSMHVNVTGLEANTFLFPKCINVRQCGGCCNHMENIVCRPVETQKVIYRLMKITLDRGDTSPSMTGFHPLEVTQHSKCSCICSLSQDVCGPLKTFNAQFCSCLCKAYVRCSPPHFFDPKTCTCECAERLLCCSGTTWCELSFNNRTCECEIQDKLFIISSANQTQGHTINDGSRLAGVDQTQGHTIDDGSRFAGGDKDQQSQTKPRINQTVQILNPDSCLGHLACPLNFEKKVNSQGHCVCANRKRHKGRN